MEPFDPTLNDAVLCMARNLVGEWEVSVDAPSTFTELKTRLDAGRPLVVYGGGSEQTIFVDPEVNHAFRAWHDWTHWTYNFDFSVDGELRTYGAQCTDLMERYGSTDDAARWLTILRADIVGQRLYYERHKRYVTDQRAFVQAYICWPEFALTNPCW